MQYTIQIAGEAWTLRMTPLRIRVLDESGKGKDRSAIVNRADKTITVSTNGTQDVIAYAAARCVAIIVGPAVAPNGKVVAHV